MREIPKQTGIPIIDIYMNELRKYLPPDNYKRMISQEDQQKVLHILKANTNRGKFSFILDAQTGDLKHQVGIYKWLGYPNNTFSIKKYLEITHPRHNIAQWINGSCTWDAIDANREWVNFYDITMVFSESLRHTKGHYLHFRCEAFPFQITIDGKGLEFAYEFSILKNHDKEDFSISFFDKNGNRPDMLEWVIRAKKKKFASFNLFSFQEMRILKCYGNNKKASMQDIATRFKISKETVATYNTRIIAKAEKLFFYEFDNAKKVAEYLKLMELM
jgi:hypothetical protein